MCVCVYILYILYIIIYLYVYCDIRWLEQDPYELIESIRVCMRGVVKAGEEEGIRVASIRGIGITNQRETTIMWDKTTGKCFYNAIGLLY